MCGINGLFSSALSAGQINKCVETMNAQLAHRGPDHSGLVQHGNTGLGHTRLSIIDLSEDSHQPFYSDDNKLVIVFNGEIYNYRELKLELQRSPQGSKQTPYFFKTQSDTEVILAAYKRWGTECVNRLNGMFAFCILNIEKEELFVVRDRLGVKPLYYHYSQNTFVFSSEIRAILHSGVKKFELNKDVMGEYIQYQTVHAPNTIVKGIQQLLPGHYLEYSQGKLSIAEYWGLSSFASKTNHLSYAQTCARTRELLMQSVHRRLVSDVPLGAFLSGGIESSAVLGLMASASSEPVNTFHVSFNESEFSESVYARAIAKKFNTRHHEIKLTPDYFLTQIESALQAMDHPGGDGPNTYMVSKATKEAGITVALSGIGGDELFAGYPNFIRLLNLHKAWWLKASPGILLSAASKLMQARKKNMNVLKAAEILGLSKQDLTSVYPLSRSLFTEKELHKITFNKAVQNTVKNIAREIKIHDEKILSTISCMELKTYLPNVLLRDTDQMSMAHALEVREPFLDYTLTEFVLSVNDQMKFPHTPKKLLTDSLPGLIPEEIIHRPKMGFTLPWQHWLKNELKMFCEKNILELDKRELVQKEAAIKLWNRFMKNDPSVGWSRVWHLVVLNYWIKNHLEDNNG